MKWHFCDSAANVKIISIECEIGWRMTFMNFYIPHRMRDSRGHKKVLLFVISI